VIVMYLWLVTYWV